MKVKSKVWIEKGPRHILGEGKAKLLEEIEKRGSISAAARATGMSFRRAWSYITAMEKASGLIFVRRFRGGRSGGGATLTNEGKKLLILYKRLNKSVREFTDKEFGKLRHNY